MKQSDSFTRHTYTKYLITSMLAIFGSVAGQMFNNMLVGNILGVEALSVTGMALPVHYVFATAGALLGIGGMTVCAQLIGKSRRQDLNESFTLTYLLIIAAAAVISLILLLNIERIISLLGTEESLAGDLREYVRIMIWCGIFNMGVYPAFHLLRLDGRTWAAVAVFGVMAAVTVLLDVILLLVLEMEIAGAAIAYGGGLAAASLFGAALLFLKSRNFKPALPGKNILRHITGILKNGSPSAAENLCILLKVLILNVIIIGSFGIAALSAFNIINSLSSFAFIFVAGVSGSIMPFAGVLYTEKDTVSIKQLFKIAVLRGLVLICIFCGICVIFASSVSALFGMSGKAELSVSVPAIILFSISLIPFMGNSILICLYQSTGRSSAANVFTVLRGLVFVTAFAWLLSREWGVTGVWHSFWLSDTLTLALTLVWALISGMRKKTLSKITLLDETAERDGKYIAFSVPADRVAVAEHSESITEFCEQNGLSPKRTTAISLAVEEFLVLILDKNERDPKITVRVLVLHDVVVLRIRYTGLLFDPVDYYRECQTSEADSLEALEAMQDSFGIKLVLGMAETVDYRPTFGESNLTITL